MTHILGVLVDYITILVVILDSKRSDFNLTLASSGEISQNLSEMSYLLKPGIGSHTAVELLNTTATCTLYII